MVATRRPVGGAVHGGPGCKGATPRPPRRRRAMVDVDADDGQIEAGTLLDGRPSLGEGPHRRVVGVGLVPPQAPVALGLGRRGSAGCAGPRWPPTPCDPSPAPRGRHVEDGGGRARRRRGRSRAKATSAARRSVDDVEVAHPGRLDEERPVSVGQALDAQQGQGDHAVGVVVVDGRHCHARRGGVGASPARAGRSRPRGRATAPPGWACPGQCDNVPTVPGRGAPSTMTCGCPRGGRPGRSRIAAARGRRPSHPVRTGRRCAGRVRGRGVRPPAECVVRRRVTVFQRMSMSGWWSISSASAPTAFTYANASAKSLPRRVFTSSSSWRSQAMPSASAASTVVASRTSTSQPTTRREGDLGVRELNTMALDGALTATAFPHWEDTPIAWPSSRSSGW